MLSYVSSIAARQHGSQTLLAHSNASEMVDLKKMVAVSAHELQASSSEFDAEAGPHAPGILNLRGSEMAQR